MRVGSMKGKHVQKHHESERRVVDTHLFIQPVAELFSNIKWVQTCDI